MFEVGFTELLLIFALALLVLGPQKLPKLAQQVGRWVGRARAMARQFRDQLEEEAHNLETKVSVDPGIDTSLEPKRPATPPAPPASPTPTAGETPPAQATPYQDVEEEFYPPDHHMHSSNRAAAEAGGAATHGEVAPHEATPGDAAPSGDGRQGELDLTSNPDQPKAP